VLTALPEVVTMTGEVISGVLAVPRVRPPEIDAIHPDKDTNRYLSLTRDSGFWVQDAGGFFYNTGEFGWGWSNYGGIYIDNVDDIQYNHNLEKLRLNWTRSVGAHQPVGDRRAQGTDPPRAGPADWWDKTDRYYAPPGVEIILHGEAACPWVEIVRHDPKGEPGSLYYWREQDGEPIYVAEPEPERLNVLRSDPYTPVANMCSPAAASTPVGIYDGNRAVFPFPANGVIYTEGNALVRGIMPPVRDSQGRSGLGIPVDEVPEGYFGWWNPMTGRSRRFDLQVVSGGTIYIEGDLMSPTTAQLTGLQPADPDVPLTMTYDQLYGSRIALLARDYVCVNTTALNPRPVDMLRPVEEPASPGTYASYNDVQLAYPPTFASYPRHWLCRGLETDPNSWDGLPVLAVPSPIDSDLRYIYTNVRLQNPDLRAELASTTELCAILGHAGWYVQDAGENGEGDSGEPLDPRASSQVSLAINTLSHTWDGPSNFYEFIVGAPSTAYESNVWLEDAAPGILQFLPQVTQTMVLDPSTLTGNDDDFVFTAKVMPVRVMDLLGNWSWVVYPEHLGYVLGPLAVAPRNRDATSGETPAPLPVDIDALIYAQNGSWFVIPGAWFNEDVAAGLQPAMEYPGYHEPLNIRLSVYGAITENMPADLGSVADWTSKWGGPVGEGASGFLAYRYDPLLRYPRRETEARVGYLRFPNFPLTSDLVIWGERVSGPAGT
ncbi:MAG TPA: hypothetical protein VMW52_08010, partial [Phycisphaerae bacterium]|nr:hypothetical protein [Phycisphaerae bacterium]